MSVDEKLERIAEQVLERLGLELVDLEQAGRANRPILRLRVDRPDSRPGHGVTVDECAAVSRELERVLEQEEDLPLSYILEVSSPGVERPLRRRRDFERCLGREIAVKGYEPLAPGSKRIEGQLVAIEGEGASEALRLRTAAGAELTVLLSAVAGANLVFRWEEHRVGKARQN